MALEELGPWLALASAVTVGIPLNMVGWWLARLP
jgi:hypothetical protein